MVVMYDGYIFSSVLFNWPDAAISLKKGGKNMKRTRSLLSLLLALALLAALFTGCAKKDETPAPADGQPTDGSAEEPAPVPERADGAAEEPAPGPAEEPAPEPDPADGPAEGPAPEPAEEDDENYDTGDASLDDPLNQDDIGEDELLVVSFGTSFNDSRRLTIGAIEKAMIAAFPDRSVRRAFTSQIIIDHIKDRDGEVIDNVTEALDRAVANGVKRLVVQPTHLMDGLEYNDLVNEVAQYADAFGSISVGKPILVSDEDFAAVANAMVEATKEFDDGKTAICYMGHGTEAESNQVYAKMQQVLTEGGNTNYFVGTVEASPTVDDVLKLVQAGNYERVVLRPMMIVAGDHANNDMAGDEEGTWKQIFESAGYEVVTEIKGLGELPAIQEILVAHAQAAIDALQ